METGKFVTFQRYINFLVRPAAIVTTGYVAGNVIGVDILSTNGQPLHIPVSELNFLALEVSYTHGSLTSLNIKVEFSEDNSNFYQVATGSISSGVDTISPGTLSLGTTDGNYYINVNAQYFNGGSFKTKYIRISTEGVGTVTSSSVGITAILGVC